MTEQEAQFMQALRQTASEQLVHLSQERGQLVERLGEIDSKIALYTAVATLPEGAEPYMLALRREKQPEEFYQPGI